jgi:carboxyl-terminal processing protease
MFCPLAKAILRRRQESGETFGERHATMRGSGGADLSPQKSRWFVALALLAGATLLGGVFAGKLSASPERDTPSLDEYADILTTLSDWAPEPVAPDKIVYASIHGMLARLDPHTAFLEPDEFSQMKEKQHGSFYGLGIQIQKRMGKITVISPMEGTPAYKMGIRAGDIITHVGDEELKDDISTEEVVRKLRGPKGSNVTITLPAWASRADPDDIPR